MRRGPVDLLPAGALPLGLGCSRLGSVGGASPDEARTVLALALEEGVRFFDTSNIYGQGDSERLIGEAMSRRDDVVVVTKAGKYVPWPKRALVPVKGLLRGSVRRSTAAKQTVGSARAKPMPTNWEPSRLRSSLHGSLRRLRREYVDVLMLHSPPVEIVERGEATAGLEDARLAGDVRYVGVSVDDVATANACLDDGRISVLQLPLHPGSDDYAEVLDRARVLGVAVIAREVLGGIGSLSGHPRPSELAQDRICRSINDPLVAITLVGATRTSSLAASVEAARSCPGGHP